MLCQQVDSIWSGRACSWQLFLGGVPQGRTCPKESQIKGDVFVTNQPTVMQNQTTRSEFSVDSNS